MKEIHLAAKLAHLMWMPLRKEAVHASVTGGKMLHSVTLENSDGLECAMLFRTLRLDFSRRRMEQSSVRLLIGEGIKPRRLTLNLAAVLFPRFIIVAFQLPC